MCCDSKIYNYSILLEKISIAGISWGSAFYSVNLVSG